MISITWVGHVLYFDKDNFHEGIKHAIQLGEPGDEDFAKYPKPPKADDGSVFHEWFAVTTKNEPIALLELADRIARNKKTHVISFHDY